MRVDLTSSWWPLCSGPDRLFAGHAAGRAEMLPASCNRRARSLISARLWPKLAGATLPKYGAVRRPAAGGRCALSGFEKNARRSGPLFRGAWKMWLGRGALAALYLIFIRPPGSSLKPAASSSKLVALLAARRSLPAGRKRVKSGA